MARIAILVLALPVGLAVAMFTVGVALFADGPTLSAERIGVIAASAALFAALGFLAGLWGGRSARWAGGLLGVSVVAVALVFGTDSSVVALAVASVVLDVAAIAGGVLLGKRAAGRRRSA